MGAVDEFVGAVRDVFANRMDARRHAKLIAGQMKTLLAAPNLMEEWFESGACDGFNVLTPMFPDDLVSFADFIVP